MSILIPDLKMPPTMGIQIIIDCGRVWVKPFGGHPEKLSERAIELPPHGRLIDADAFSAKIIEIVERQKYDDFYDQRFSVGAVLREVVIELKGDGLDGYANAPTIIESEEGIE